MAFPTSPLSQENVLRDVHNPDTQSLRVETGITPGSVEVVISHTDDSIRLGDGTKLVTATQDGSKVGLDVNVIGPVDIGTNVTTNSYYNEVIGVASGVLTTIASLTLVAERSLQRVSVGGTNISEYTVVIDGVVIDKRYTHFGNLNVDFVYDAGMTYPPGTVIEIQTIHNRPMLGDFNARIQTTEQV